jgi:hypothetical protein
MNRPNRLPAPLHAPADEESAVRARPECRAGMRRREASVGELVERSEQLLLLLPKDAPVRKLLGLAVLRRDGALMRRLLIDYD